MFKNIVSNRRLNFREIIARTTDEYQPQKNSILKTYNTLSDLLSNSYCVISSSNSSKITVNKEQFRQVKKEFRNLLIEIKAENNNSNLSLLKLDANRDLVKFCKCLGINTKKDHISYMVYLFAMKRQDLTSEIKSNPKFCRLLHNNKDICRLLEIVTNIYNQDATNFGSVDNNVLSTALKKIEKYNIEHLDGAKLNKLAKSNYELQKNDISVYAHKISKLSKFFYENIGSLSKQKIIDHSRSLLSSMFKFFDKRSYKKIDFDNLNELAAQKLDLNRVLKFSDMENPTVETTTVSYRNNNSYASFSKYFSFFPPSTLSIIPNARSRPVSFMSNQKFEPLNYYHDTPSFRREAGLSVRSDPFNYENYEKNSVVRDLVLKHQLFNDDPNTFF